MVRMNDSVTCRHQTLVLVEALIRVSDEEAAVLREAIGLSAFGRQRLHQVPRVGEQLDAHVTRAQVSHETSCVPCGSYTTVTILIVLTLIFLIFGKKRPLGVKGQISSLLHAKQLIYAP